MENNTKKIWVDLDNSPHVLFFEPIIRELETLGFKIIVTVRDHAQVCELADLHNLQYIKIGRHYGKSSTMKVLGLFIRTAQMIPFIIKNKPDLALSHGSRSQLLISELTCMPNALAYDYEHSRGLPFVHPSMVIVPELLPETGLRKNIKNTIRYPGIKEDVYVPDFKPDDRIKDELGLNSKDIIATVRPPAMDAHYQNPESGELFKSVIDFLGRQDNIRIVLLPRVDKQASYIKNTWSHLFAKGKMIIPEHVVNGLNLIWHSDLVLSGGGTIIREAAALNVPAFSFFKGKTGEVDRYLTDTGRLTMIQTVDDVQNKILVQKRHVFSGPNNPNNNTLQYIVQHIKELAK